MDVEFEGYLWKAGKNRMSSYQRRYFRLVDDELQYLERSDSTELKGSIDLSMVESLRPGNPAQHSRKAVAVFA